jgi:hypothetical protein
MVIYLSVRILGKGLIEIFWGLLDPGSEFSIDIQRHKALT